MTHRRAARAVPLILVLAVAAACTSGSGTSARGPSTNPSSPRLLASPSLPTPSPSPSPPTSFQRSTVLTGHTGPITALAWSPDGALLASAAGRFGSRDSTIRIWTPRGVLVAVLRAHSCGVFALAWSPDGRTLASGSCDGTARLWDRHGGLVGRLEPHAGAVMAVAWSPDGKLLATGSVAGPARNTVDVWDHPRRPGDAADLFRRRTLYSGGKFYNLGWSPDGRFLVGGATDYREWRADGSQVFATYGCPGCTPQWGFAWAPDGSSWGIGNESGVVSVYGVDGTDVASMQNSGGNVDVMAWSADGMVLAGGNSLWRIEDGRAIVQGSLGGGRVSGLAWSKLGPAIAASFWNDNGVDVRSAEGTLMARLLGHRKPVGIVAWSPDGTVLATGSDDGTVRLWNLGAFLQPVPGPS